MRFSNFFFPFWGSFSWTETAAAFGSRKFGRPFSAPQTFPSLIIWIGGQMSFHAFLSKA